MKERPILFSAPMVRAILDGTKTQTRRIIKGHALAFLAAEHKPVLMCPYGQPGDQLWVRETWKPKISHSCGMDTCDCEEIWVDYPADGEGRYFRSREIHEDWVFPAKHKRGNSIPSIHMPRWASRLSLGITGVRVERLQDISEADAIAEGIELIKQQGRMGDPLYRNYGCPEIPDRSARYSYQTLWEFINGAGSWDANPWVWVVEFKRVQAG